MLLVKSGYSQLYRILSTPLAHVGRRVRYAWLALLTSLLLIIYLFNPLLESLATLPGLTNTAANTTPSALVKDTSANSDQTPILKEQAAAAYGRLPLSFEANQGQTDPSVNFIARGAGYTLFLTPSAAVMSLQKPAKTPTDHNLPARPGFDSTPKPTQAQNSEQQVLQMKLVGANPRAAAVGQAQLPGISNYFIGNDPTKWHANIPNYARIEYQEVYPSIGMSYYGNNGQLEYDFNLKAGADPQQIRLDFGETAKVELQANGSLLLHLGDSQFTMPVPVIYQQQENGQRQTVRGGYVLQGDHEISFQLDGYDASRPLTIDPILSYSTYVGGSGDDYGVSIAVDSSGNAYITGNTVSIV